MVLFAMLYASVASAKFTVTVKSYGGGKRVGVQRYTVPGKYDGRIPTYISQQAKAQLRGYNGRESVVISASSLTPTNKGMLKKTDRYTFSLSVNALKRKAQRQWGNPRKPQPHVRGNFNTSTARIGRYPAYPVVKDKRFRPGTGVLVNRFASCHARN
jgi:hypothetical protein